LAATEQGKTVNGEEKQKERCKNRQRRRRHEKKESLHGASKWLETV
jgi:hypothetical protein